MRLSTKKLVVPASLAILASSSLVRGAIIYTAQGFETAGDFSTTGAPGFPANDSDAADLYGQGNPFWAPTITPPSYTPAFGGGNGVKADVETTVVESGLQAIGMQRISSSADTRWAPSTFFPPNAYTPTAPNTSVIDVDWDMRVASGGSDDLFGIELNDGSGANGRIAFVAVDQAGHIFDDHGGTTTDTGAPAVSTDAWEHYELQANFTTDKYSIYLNGSSTPLDTFAFENNDTAFTDASLVSLSGDGGPGAGIAYYDNYVIAAVPEPTGKTAVLAGGGLLLLRRRRRDGSAV